VSEAVAADWADAVRSRWRLALWCVALFLLDAAAIALAFYAAFDNAVAVGAGIVVLSTASAWAFGLFRNADGVAIAAAGSLVAAAAALILVFIVAVQMIPTDPPAILRDAPADSDAAITKALAKTFPNGTAEDAMARELRAEGFAVDRVRRVAVIQWSNIACGTTLDVGWTASAGHRVTSIKSGTTYACL
jgi:hypothetical protein